MTGLQLAQTLQEKYPGLPVILATGYAELPADPPMLRLTKLAKPCSQHDIAVAIQNTLNARSAVSKIEHTLPTLPESPRRSA
jgi:FixJ family two-component response regulator